MKARRTINWVLALSVRQVSTSPRTRPSKMRAESQMTPQRSPREPLRAEFDSAGYSLLAHGWAGKSVQ